MSKTRIRFENLSEDGSVVESELEPLIMTAKQAECVREFAEVGIQFGSKLFYEKYDLKADVESVRSKADVDS